MWKTQICLFLLLSLLAQPAAADEKFEDKLLNLLYEVVDALKEEEELQQAKEEAAASRYQLFHAALKLEEQRKKDAKSEREVVDLKLQKLKFEASVRRWALESVMDTSANAYSGEELKKVAAEWKNNRKALEERYFNSSDQARPAIRDGRTLNYMLHAFGDTLVRIQETRKLADDNLREMQAQCDSLDNQMSAAVANQDGKQAERIQAERQAAYRDLETYRARVKILEELGEPQPIPPELLKHLNFTKGLLGAKSVINNAKGVMPIHWPTFIREDEEFAPYIQPVEDAREAAVAELESGQPLSTDSIQMLLKAVENLEIQFLKKSQKFVKSQPDGVAKQHYFEAKKYVTITLRYSVARLVEAENLNDVQPQTFSTGTLADLVDYMTREGLQFAPARTSDEASYTQLHHLMLKAYSDLRTFPSYLSYHLAETENQISHQKKFADELSRIQYNDSLDTLASAINKSTLFDNIQTFATEVAKNWGDKTPPDTVWDNISLVVRKHTDQPFDVSDFSYRSERIIESNRLIDGWHFKFDSSGILISSTQP